MCINHSVSTSLLSISISLISGESLNRSVDHFGSAELRQLESPKRGGAAGPLHPPLLMGVDVVLLALCLVNRLDPSLSIDLTRSETKILSLCESAESKQRA